MKMMIQKWYLALALSGLALLPSCSNVSSLSSSWSADEKSDNGLPLKPSEDALARAAKISAKDKHGYKTYEDSVRTRVVRTTSFSHKEREPGAPGRKNCLGGTLKYGDVRSAAADWSVYPVGTKFRIKGLPQLFVVDDFGSALAGTNTVDIFHPSLSLMRKWGTREAQITIVQWGDYDRSLRLLQMRKRYSHCRKMLSNLERRMEKGKVASSEVTAEELAEL